MSQKQTVNRVYLSVDDELEARLAVAYAAAKKGRRTYSQNEFLQSLVRFALEHQEDMKGSKMALAYRLGDRIAEKMDNLMVVILAIFHLVAAQFDAPDEVKKRLKNEAFSWAAQHSAAMAQRIAELRHSVPPKPSDTDPVQM